MLTLIFSIFSRPRRWELPERRKSEPPIVSGLFSHNNMPPQVKKIQKEQDPAQTRHKKSGGGAAPSLAYRDEKSPTVNINDDSWFNQFFPEQPDQNETFGGLVKRQMQCDRRAWELALIIAPPSALHVPVPLSISITESDAETPRFNAHAPIYPALIIEKQVDIKPKATPALLQEVSLIFNAVHHIGYWLNDLKSKIRGLENPALRENLLRKPNILAVEEERLSQTLQSIFHPVAEKRDLDDTELRHAETLPQIMMWYAMILRDCLEMEHKIDAWSIAAQRKSLSGKEFLRPYFSIKATELKKEWRELISGLNLEDLEAARAACQAFATKIPNSTRAFQNFINSIEQARSLAKDPEGSLGLAPDSPDTSPTHHHPAQPRSGSNVKAGTQPTANSVYSPLPSEAHL